MKHPTGVRLQLRKKDCIDSMALVDAIGAVWYQFVLDVSSGEAKLTSFPGSAVGSRRNIQCYTTFYTLGINY